MGRRKSDKAKAIVDSDSRVKAVKGKKAREPLVEDDFYIDLGDSLQVETRPRTSSLTVPLFLFFLQQTPSQ